MALIKCPECGRENVSDSAISCPDCGFAIREYFEERKKQEVNITKDNDVSKITDESVKIDMSEMEELNNWDENTYTSNTASHDKEAVQEKHIFRYLITALIICAVIAISVVFIEMDVIHIISPYYKSEEEMINALQGVWSEQTYKYIEDEIIISEKAWNSYTDYTDDDDPPRHQSGKIHIDNYKTGTFYLQNSSVSDRVKMKVADGKITEKGYSNYYVKIPSSQLANIKDTRTNYEKLSDSEKKEICQYIQSRFDYYDKLENGYSGDKYSDQIWEDAARKWGISETEVSIIWQKYSY